MKMSRKYLPEKNNNDTCIYEIELRKNRNMMKATILFGVRVLRSQYFIPCLVTKVQVLKMRTLLMEVFIKRSPTV